MSKYNKITKELMEEAQKLILKGYNKKQVAEKLNLCYRTFLNHYEKQYPNTHFRKGAIPFDYNFFETIDTEEKAYWLGFIYADGHINNNNLVINLAYKDVEHLERFLYDIKSQHKINKKIVYLNGNEYYQCRVSISNKKMIEDLKSYGLKNNKTYDCFIPFEKIPNELMHHYIRGVFDGDGSVFNNGYNNRTDLKLQRLGVTVATSASHLFINDLINYLFDFADIACTYNIDSRRRKTNHVDNYSCQINKTREIQRFYFWLYNNATVFLKRKHDIFAVSDQIAWRPEIISAELSGETVKSKDTQSEPKAYSDISQGQSIDDDPLISD